MITTREINVDLRKGGKFDRVTTKDIDASPKVKLPKKPIKAKGISTSNIADVADILEKKRRDDIAEERKLAMKNEKKIIFKVDNEGDSVIVEKKPWKEMTDDEKRIEMKRRVVKAKATKARKKKENDERKDKKD